MEEEAASPRAGTGERWSSAREHLVTGGFMIAAAIIGAVIGAVAHAAVVPPTKVEVQVPVPVLVTPAPTAAPEMLFRDEGQPADGTTVTRDMPAGSVIYFSGSQFDYQGRSCRDAQRLCVFLDTITSPGRRVEIGNVIAGSNFVEGRTGISELALLQTKTASFWDGTNCGGVCEYVDVYFFEDGQERDHWRLTEAPKP